MSEMTIDYKETINSRLNTDLAYSTALLDEAITLFLNGEPDTARIILRDLANSTVGFEDLLVKTDTL